MPDALAQNNDDQFQSPAPTERDNDAPPRLRIVPMPEVPRGNLDPMRRSLFQ
jgi:hypothetical protein